MSPLHGNPGGVARVCVRPPLRVNGDAHKRARGGAPLPIPARPLLPFSQPPPSRVPPQFVRDWGHKKGGCAPPPPRRTLCAQPFAQKRLHNGRGAPPPAWFVRRPGPPFRTGWAQRGVPTLLPVRARAPLLCTPFPFCTPSRVAPAHKPRVRGREAPLQVCVPPLRGNGGRQRKGGGLPAQSPVRVTGAGARAKGGAVPRGLALASCSRVREGGGGKWGGLPFVRPLHPVR